MDYGTPDMNIRAMDLVEDWAWFCSHNPIFRVEDSCGMVCTNKNGERTAAVVFDNYTGVGGSMQGHFVILSPLVLKSGFIGTCADFAFKARKALALYAVVPSNNEKALSFDRKIGFKQVARLRGAFSEGVDSIIMELREEEYYYGKEKLSPTQG